MVTCYTHHTTFHSPHHVYKLLCCLNLVAKKIPLRDLAHLRYDNSMPLIEGEKPILVRAGSDGVLNVHDSQPEFMQVGINMSMRRQP